MNKKVNGSHLESLKHSWHLVEICANNANTEKYHIGTISRGPLGIRSRPASFSRVLAQQQGHHECDRDREAKGDNLNILSRSQGQIDISAKVECCQIGAKLGDPLGVRW